MPFTVHILFENKKTNNVSFTKCERERNERVLFKHWFLFNVEFIIACTENVSMAIGGRGENFSLKQHMRNRLKASSQLRCLNKK